MLVKIIQFFLAKKAMWIGSKYVVNRVRWNAKDTIKELKKEWTIYTYILISFLVLWFLFWLFKSIVLTAVIWYIIHKALYRKENK